MEIQVREFENQILRAARGAGVELLGNQLAGLLNRAIREGHVRNAVKELRRQARDPRTASTLARRIGPVNEVAGDTSGAVEMVRNGNEVEDRGSYKQLRKLRYDACGKRVSKAMRIQKLLASSIRSTTYRWQALAAGTDTTRTLPISTINYATATTPFAANDLRLPFYMWDLTSLMQPQAAPGTFDAAGNPSAGVLAPHVGFGLYRTGTDYRWYTLSQRTPNDAGVAYSWQIEDGMMRTYADPNGTTSRPFVPVTPKAFLKGAMVKLFMQGAKTRPSRITVQVWQFKDEDLVPPAFVTTNVGAAGVAVEGYPTGDDASRYNEFWASETDNLFNNPLVTRSAKRLTGGNTHRVLYSKTFEFNPISNDEADTRGHQVQWGLNVNLNKIASYTEVAAGQNTLTNANLIDEDFYDVVQDFNRLTPHCAKLGRVFLVVKALNLETATSEATVDPFPSFDIVIRRKHMFTGDQWMKNANA